MAYICKHCGRKENDLSWLTQLSCNASPTKKHQPLESGIQAEYVCKHCGRKEKDLSWLTQLSCNASPTKKHQPL